MTPPSLPSLDIPPDIATPIDFNTSPKLSRSPSAHGLNAATGRPAKWTPFHLVKMACLYVYTNLPLQKIIDVVHHKSPLGSQTPGTDSANKNLNVLLDKEPRWIHPRTLEDMGQRLEQLALSPSQMSSQSSDSSSCRAWSDPPASNLLHTPLKTQGNVSPTALDVPHHSMDSWSAPTSPVASYYGRVKWSPPQQGLTARKYVTDAKEETERELFAPYLRRATVTSSSTATSASSLRSVLAEYSSPYRAVVKRLMRQIPRFSQRSRHTSPISEANSTVMDWLNDEVAPAAYDGSPFPLPGDFLKVDQYVQQPDMLDQHRRYCLLSDADELRQAPASALPWVTPSGLTEKGSHILAGLVSEFSESDFSDMDVFGNTLLHFVAARDTGLMSFYNILIHPKASDILQTVNSAGQSFLHVMHQDTMNNKSFVSWLVSEVRQSMDIYAQDHYGRNFFHMLRTSGVSQTVLQEILEPNDAVTWNTRDAFGSKPYLYTSESAHMVFNLSSDSIPSLASASVPVENRAIAAQRQLVTFVGRAINEDPAAEYSQGRNGLHCLAAANLSMVPGTISSDTADSTPSPATAGGATMNGRRRTSGGNKRETDSSEARLKVRLKSLKELLDSGVRANAYDNNGNTPLMAFAAQLLEDGDYKIGPEILTTLINSGGDVNARNRAGETALHIAVRCGRKLAARTLVNAGANVYARDAAGRSVLGAADAKIMALSGNCPGEYARLMACRAWLSGQKGGAVQNPTVLQEWGRRA